METSKPGRARAENAAGGRGPMSIAQVIYEDLADAIAAAALGDEPRRNCLGDVDDDCA
jgi:hypothetical protein